MDYKSYLNKLKLVVRTIIGKDKFLKHPFCLTGKFEFLSAIAQRGELLYLGKILKAVKNLIPLEFFAISIVFLVTVFPWNFYGPYHCKTLPHKCIGILQNEAR